MSWTEWVTPSMMQTQWNAQCHHHVHVGNGEWKSFVTPTSEAPPLVKADEFAQLVGFGNLRRTFDGRTVLPISWVNRDPVTGEDGLFYEWIVGRGDVEGVAEWRPRIWKWLVESTNVSRHPPKVRRRNNKIATFLKRPHGRRHRQGQRSKHLKRWARVRPPAEEVPFSEE
jgi:hypothetical protein